MTDKLVEDVAKALHKCRFERRNLRWTSIDTWDCLNQQELNELMADSEAAIKAAGVEELEALVKDYKSGLVLARYQALMGDEVSDALSNTHEPEKVETDG